MNAPHPDDQTLKAYGLGKLDDGSASTINDHLETCPECRDRVSGFTSDSFLGRFQVGHQPSARSILGGSLIDGTVSFMQGRASSPPPPTDTLPPGLAENPNYEIKRELGRGGMGVVYLAHNKIMGRDEVLKVMSRHIMERPGVLERFLREIRAVAKLRHPNIVAAYHAFPIEGGLVFAMEHIEGLDLARLVKAKGPLSVAHAAYFVHQAALGLQHAHEKGLIHRDIKPQNLMLTHDGKARLIKVLDFGLAKATREEKVDVGLTSEGQALGTPDFIATEQIVNALDVDIRADLYSLGGTLFYLLTGRPPFQCTSLYDLYQAHMSRDAEPLNLIRPEVPSELAALVAKMMDKEPNRRFQTPGEVAKLLTPFFQKGGAVSKVRKPDVYWVAPSPSALPTDRAASTNRTATDRAGSVVRPEKALAPFVPESRSASTIKSRETGPGIDQAPSAFGPTLGRSWLPPLVGVGVLVIGLLAAWLSGVFKVKTSDGYLVLEGVPNDAEIRVDGAKINVTWPGSGRPIEIQAVPGQHRVEVKRGGFRTFGEVVILRDLESKEVTVRLEPLVVAKPAPSPADIPGVKPQGGSISGRPELPPKELNPGFPPFINEPTPETASRPPARPPVEPRPDAVPAEPALEPNTEIYIKNNVVTKGTFRLTTKIENFREGFDPLNGLPPPLSLSTIRRRSALSLDNITGDQLIFPGIYKGGIHISGICTVRLNPGVYVLDGGGLSLKGICTLIGEKVVILNIPSKSTDVIEINGTVAITPPSTLSGVFKPFNGISIYQNPNSNALIKLGGNSEMTLGGTLYAPGASLIVGGNAQLHINRDAASNLPGRVMLSDLTLESNGGLLFDTPSRRSSSRGRRGFP